MLPILAAAQGKKAADVLECNFCSAAITFAKYNVADASEDVAGLLQPDTTVPIEPLRRGLLDHRRPVFQGGDEEPANLQLFCETCNNLKANICNRCPYGHHCDGCIWAFPEKVRSRRIVLVLPDETIQKLRKRFGDNITEALTDLLEKME